MPRLVYSHPYFFRPQLGKRKRGYVAYFYLRNTHERDSRHRLQYDVGKAHGKYRFGIRAYLDACAEPVFNLLQLRGYALVIIHNGHTYAGLNRFVAFP